MTRGVIPKQELIKKIGNEIEYNELGAFIGAGLSITAGYCNWSKLLQGPAEEIGLNVEKELDLISLAQYYCNVYQRESVDNLIKETFSRSFEPSINHNLLAQLPIYTYWTTNYDKLIEKALENNNKRPYVKTRDEQLRGRNRDFDVIVYKLHGDVDLPGEAVITRSDYEEFGYSRRKLFREILEGDLLTKTFLFLGFSFSDPNINYIIGRLRVLLAESGTRKHYCIMKRIQGGDEGANYEKIRQELQIEDLNRYGIYTCLVDDYDEITEILRTIVDRYRRKTIFISGSADDYRWNSPEIAQNFIHKLAFALVESDYHIVNGYGKGVGEFVLNGVAEYCLINNFKISDYLTIMPFPQQSSKGKQRIELKDIYNANREEMINKSGIAIFLFGNKKGENVAQGVMEEFDLSKKHKLICLPIGYTGGAAEKIYNEIMEETLDDKYKRVLEQINEGNIEKVDDSVEKIIQVIKELK